MAAQKRAYKFTPSASQTRELNDLVALLDPVGDGPPSIHVHGHPGVGKTRLLLKTCSEAPWSPLVLYFPRATDLAQRVLRDLAQSRALTVAVVDETPGADAIHYARIAALAEAGRLKMVTIGTSAPESADVEYKLRLEPHTEEETASVVRGWWPGMPREQVVYVARLSDGYLRLARLLAEYVLEHPTATTETILDSISSVVTALIPDIDRRHLYVLSVLRVLGWRGPLEDEGRIVSQAFRVEWSAVKAAVTLERQYGIVRRAETLLYVSPFPLALYLALEAWRHFSGELRDLREALPREEARRAFDHRIAEIGGVLGCAIATPSGQGQAILPVEKPGSDSRTLAQPVRDVFCRKHINSTRGKP